MGKLECCICGKPCKSVGAGGSLYCGEQRRCASSRVFVLYRTDSEASWAHVRVRAVDPVFIRARTKQGERAALRTIRQARPDVIFQIKGVRLERVR